MDWGQVLAIVLPVMLAITIGIFYNNRRLDDSNRRMDDLRSDMNQRFTEVNQQLADIRAEMREIRMIIMKKEIGV